VRHADVLPGSAGAVAICRETASAGFSSRDIDGWRAKVSSALVEGKPLYGSLIGLQALDLESTIRAIGSGAGRESNPMLQSVVGRPAALLAVKAGASGLIIFACERLRKEKHPAAAVVLMIGINSAYAIVVAHNYALANSSR
jgi:Domain of unknown function (DUF5658)